jgi:predicted nucleic acid-binding protein
MHVVSNTSPLSNLAVIRRLDLLRERYGRVTIPAEAWSELSALRHADALASQQQAVADGWLRVETPAVPLAFPIPLDPGESAAISLAVSSEADLLLIDELKGRSVARGLGLVIGGLLGELLHARLSGRILSLAAEIQRLRSEAGFFVGGDIERFLLSHAGE